MTDNVGFSSWTTSSKQQQPRSNYTTTAGVDWSQKSVRLSTKKVGERNRGFRTGANGEPVIRRSATQRSEQLRSPSSTKKKQPGCQREIFDRRRLRAHRPLPQPSRASYAGLGGRTVRLEAPDKLPGTWAGPVYATLSRDLQLRTEAPGPFFDDADGLKRPAWQAHLTFLLPGERREDLEPALREHVDVPYWIPHWRLTPTSEDLRGELQERPLLSVFRFLRFTEYFVATPRDDTKFTKRTSDVFLCGQVLAYQPATSIALVDDIDLLQEPSCSYICLVAIRAYAGVRHQVVAIPLIDVRHNAISRLEFVLGSYHGLPATLQIPPFDTAWRAFRTVATDSTAMRAALEQPLGQWAEPLWTWILDPSLT